MVPLCRWKQLQKENKVPARQAFDPSAVVMPNIPEQNNDGEDIGYVIGYTFVPAYMRGKLANLPPVSAVDAAHAKRPAVGTFFAEACIDSERRIHPIFISHIMCTENLWAYRTAFRHAAEAHGPSFLERTQVKRPIPITNFLHPNTIARMVGLRSG